MANLVTYAKQKWEDAKTAITAARLNNMEDGIGNCAAQINALGDSVCQLKQGTGTTSATIEIGSSGEVVFHVMSATKHTSINFYASEIMVYDEIGKRRIASYAKTS